LFLWASNIISCPEEKICEFNVSQNRIFIKIYGHEWTRREAEDSFIVKKTSYSALFLKYYLRNQSKENEMEGA
jgi:hypothetical protein